MKSKAKTFLLNNEIISFPLGLKSGRNIPAILESWLTLFVLFSPILADAQMNHANDLGPALLHYSEINI